LGIKLSWYAIFLGTIFLGRIIIIFIYITRLIDVDKIIFYKNYFIIIFIFIVLVLSLPLKFFILKDSSVNSIWFNFYTSMNLILILVIILIISLLITLSLIKNEKGIIKLTFLLN